MRGTGRSGAMIVTAALVCVAGLVGCSSDDDSRSSGSKDSIETTTEPSPVSTTTAPKSVAPLRVLVTNDDGIGAPGIDAIVEALRALPDTDVTVIAPLTNQSGTGSKTSPEPPAVTDVPTTSGFAGKAVAGFPADSVIYALDGGGIATRPDLVVSGINSGANIGPFVTISGTVGAAKAAAQRGIPALAASQGFGDPPDFPSGVKYVLEWVAEHRSAILAGNQAASVVNLNIPTCTSGAIRGTQEVSTAATDGGRDLVNSNCASTTTSFADDVDAFGNGFVTLSEIPAA